MALGSRYGFECEKPATFIFCALACEARPLIKAWRLKKMALPTAPFTIYADQSRVIVITGIGKAAMAGAVGYVMALFVGSSADRILINLGIAGHPQHGCGEVFLADKIVDVETGKAYFPQLPFIVPCRTIALTTYSRPQIDYKEAALSDMEAVGFYEMATKFSSNELIHVVKIVSDNQYSSIDNINEVLVENWVGDRLVVIDELIGLLNQSRALLKQVDVHSLSEPILQRFHFTQANTNKLNALLKRWVVIRSGQALLWEDAKVANAAELLVWLERQLNCGEFYL
jgi:hypothetical protein